MSMRNGEVKAVIFLQCNNRWNNALCPKQRKLKMTCDECEYRDWTKLTLDKIIAHLVGYKEDGSDVLEYIRFSRMEPADFWYLILIIMKRVRRKQISRIQTMNGRKK